MNRVLLRKKKSLIFMRLLKEVGCLTSSLGVYCLEISFLPLTAWGVM